MSETEQSPKRKWPKYLAIALAVLVVLGVVAVAVVVMTLRGSLPTMDGEVASGVAAPVTIERDGYGIPTITAETRADAAYALGFLHAQERFFQMDLTRRAAAGELSELFGKPAVDFDKGRRLHRTSHTAKAAFERTPKRHRDLMERYTAGVNDGFAALGAKPFEYQLLGHDPRPWAPSDTMLVILAMYFDLQDETAVRDRYRAALYDAVPAPMAEWLLPRGNATWDAPIDGSEVPIVPMPGPEVVDIRTHDAWKALLDGPQARAPVDIDGPVIGSNSWAVAGTRSHHGGAIVADDMHLGLRIPIIWYRAAMTWKDGETQRRVEGVTLPGGPVVVVGSNTEVAWAFTNSQVDTVDAIRLELDGDGYRTPTGTEAFVEYTDTIAVSGGAPVEYTYRWTKWGPVVDDDVGRPTAAEWVAHDPASIDVGLFDLETASTIEEAMDVANAGGTPTQNFVVGDSTGRIGWTLFGPVPTRDGYEGRLARSSTDPGTGFTGRLKDYPRVIDPPEGLLWTANARIVGGAMYAKVGENGYSLGARQQQIRDLLRAKGEKGKLTEDDMLAIQLDDRAIFLAPWRAHLQALLDGDADPLRARAKHHLDNSWTGRASPDSVGYRLVRELRDAISDEVMGALTAPAKAVHPEFAYIERGGEGPVWDVITAEPAHLLHPAHDSWKAWKLAIIDARLAELTKDAADPVAALDARTYGEINVPRIAHPLSRGLPPSLMSVLRTMGAELAPTLDPLPGDDHMPRAQNPTWGPSEHMAVSPGKEDQGYLSIPGGQSGHPLSPHYFDQYPKWAAGERITFQPGAAQHTLTLVPGG